MKSLIVVAFRTSRDACGLDVGMWPDHHLTSPLHRCDEIKAHTSEEVAKMTQEIKAHISAKDRIDIFVAAQPMPVTLWPIGMLEHQICLEYLRQAFKLYFDSKATAALIHTALLSRILLQTEQSNLPG